MKSIYLDCAAATPVGKEVLAAMQPYFSDQFYNPSATYLAGRKAHSELERIRGDVAQSLGVKPAEIIFTAGATEANNLAVTGVAQNFPKSQILASAIEHDSVLAPAKKQAAKLIPVTKQGIVDLDALAKLVTDKTVLVSVMLVNNELGTIQPLREISNLLNQLSKSRKSKLPLYLHTDAAQAGNFLDLNPARLGVDLLSLNGGKIYGPKQSGALYVKAGVKLGPLILGGGQEFGLRSGTENLAAAAGLAAALAKARADRESQSWRLNGLRVDFEKHLLAKIKNAQINGAPRLRAPHITSLTIAGTDNERLMMQLDELGVMAAVGSACSASSDEPSHVLSAIGLSRDEARATLRFSLGRNTSAEDLNYVVESLAKMAG